MAIKLLIVSVVLAGIVNGQIDLDDDEEFSPNMVYHYEPALPLPSPPPLPYIPGLPQPPPLPSPPPLLMLGPARFPRKPSFRRQIDFHQQPEIPELDDFVQHPEFPPFEFPTVEEIASQTPKPGGTFDGVIISSKSKATRAKDGTINRKGGSTVILNENGTVTVNKMGDSPPEVIITKEPAFPDFPSKFNFKPHRPHKPRFGGPPFGGPPFGGPPFGGPPFGGPPFGGPPFGGPSFEEPPFGGPHFGGHPFGVPPFGDFPPPKPFVPLDPDIIKNYVPKDGEHYTGSSSSSHSYSSNVNGVKSSGGSVSALTNVDGDVEEKKLAFDKSDPKP